MSPAGVLAAAALTSCNLLTGAADLVVEGSGAPAAGAADAGPDGTAILPEGGGDARPDGDKDGGVVLPGCIPGAIFCDDFDGPDGLKKWGSLKIGGGASTIDAVAAVSPPSSLLLSWPAVPTGSTAGVELQAPLGSGSTAPRIVRISFSVRIESTGGKDADFLAIAQIKIGSVSTLSLAVSKNGSTQLEETVNSGSGGGTTTTAPLAIPLDPSNAFQTVSISLSLAPVALALVEIGGKQAGSKNLSTSSGALALVLGDRDVQGTNDVWRVRYDNVVVLAQ